ncbi:MAG: pirin family protein, partial [Deltaproteobacteria bacterium]|nr:pirin family protein [Kofleriaceae bacterium]
MIDSLVDARQFAAGAIRTALAAPVGPDDAPRTIGPFAVVAHALPLASPPGELPPDFDVRPHPHIGLAAVTCMLEGHTTHRDSLGSRQEVGPGGVNFMIAGRGVVHSERFERLRTLGGTLELLQILLALPDGHEELEPRFVHVAPADVPRSSEGGALVRRLAGDDTALPFPTPVFLHVVQLEPGARYLPPAAHRERAVYVVSGAIAIDGSPVRAQQTALLAPETTYT